MPKLILLALALASLSAVLACSDNETAPAAQPTTEAVPTAAPEATVPPTATAQPTATPQKDGSGDVGGDGSTEGMGLPPDILHPVAFDEPQAFLSKLSPGERSCLEDKGIDSEELSQMTGRSPGGSPESTVDIVNCLQDDTVLRVFLTSLVGQVEPFSRETSACIREGFVPIDMRRLLAPAVAGGAPANSLALSMVALNVSVVCMNDDEWAIYAPRLGMEPGDRDAAACLFEELGGPANLAEAMQEASLGEMPEELTRAWKACGLEDSGPPS